MDVVFMSVIQCSLKRHVEEVGEGMGKGMGEEMGEEMGEGDTIREE